jgi:lysozyme family protein
MMTEKEDALSIDERRFLFEKELETKKLELQKLELEIRHLEVESKIASDKKTLKNISPVTATILVALISFLGTSIATFLQGKNTNNLEREKFENSSAQERAKFQSSLILKALEGETPDDRIKFLNFLTSTKLIEDTGLANRLSTFINKTPEDIPFVQTSNNTRYNLDSIKKNNKDLFNACVINPDRQAEVDSVTKEIISNKSKYEIVANKTGIPWQAIALIHYSEANFNFKTHLANGDPLTARTVHVPKGRPISGEPPFTWEESAIDCITMSGLKNYNDWSTKGLLTALEKYNGLGYRLNKKINSPYLWVGSNNYTKGGFTADAVYDPNKIVKRIGVAVILKELANKGYYQYKE